MNSDRGRKASSVVVALVCLPMLTLLSSCGQSPTSRGLSTDRTTVLKAGDNVFVKPDANAMMDGVKVDVENFSVLVTIVDVKDEKVFLGAAWVPRSDVMTFDEAFDYYNKQIEADPKSAYFWKCRGFYWQQKGEFDKAIKDTNEAIRLEPADADAYFNRGYLWLASEKFENAIKDFDEAIRLEPTHAEAFASRGHCWIEEGESGHAIKDLTEAIRLDPENADIFADRGSALLFQGEVEKAIKDYSEAIRLKPKLAGALSNLAWIQATCADDRLRDGTAAVANATKACELSAWKDSESLGTLAAACAEVGDFTNAVKWQEKSLALKPEKQARGLTERLELYRSNKPYRETP